MLKKVFMSFVALLAIAAAATGPARAQYLEVNGDIETLSSNTTCTHLSVKNSAMLIVNQGVTLTLNCVNNDFDLSGYSDIELHGTMTGSAGSDTYWGQNSYILVYLFDGAKYTVSGLECEDGDYFLYYYGYNAATDGHGSVSVTNGSTTVTDNTVGYRTTTYTFTATPNSGYRFVNWTKGAGGEELGTAASIAVTCEQNGQYQVYANFEEVVPHTVRFAAGNDGWQVQDVTTSASATAPAILQNVMAGDSLVVTAPATLPGKVKSVKAVKYVAPAATVTTAPTATAAIIEAGSTTALVNAGAANGGTMMYAVTTTNAQPASTADFSADIPTAQGRTKGSYYVWYYAKADADHSDSEIAGPVSVTLAVMSTVTWSSTNVFNSGHEGEELDEFSPNPRTYEGITISKSGPDYSYFRAYDHVSQTGKLTCWGDNGDSFTFTAPSGKKFCKIEIINDEWSIGFTNYGDWTQPEDNKIVWSGTAANEVTLGSVFVSASNLTSIVFTLIDAQ